MKRIVLDICLSQIPAGKIKEAKNGQRYVKLVLTEMRQPDRWGNEYTIFALQQPDEDRVYVGKGKAYEAKPANDYPSEL